MHEKPSLLLACASRQAPLACRACRNSPPSERARLVFNGGESRNSLHALLGCVAMRPPLEAFCHERIDAPLQPALVCLQSRHGERQRKGEVETRGVPVPSSSVAESLALTRSSPWAAPRADADAGADAMGSAPRCGLAPPEAQSAAPQRWRAAGTARGPARTGPGRRSRWTRPAAARRWPPPWHLERAWTSNPSLNCVFRRDQDKSVGTTLEAAGW